MACLYSNARTENARYAAHTRFLARHGVRVARLLHDFPSLQAGIYEDLGQQDLTRLASSLPMPSLHKIYQCVLDQMIRMHGTVRAARAARLSLEPPFSQRIYRWEHQLFESHYMERRLHLPHPKRRQVMEHLADLADSFRGLRQVLLHRDLQSSNIFLVNGETAFIDYQGMRYGPAAYDLASLICDPYVNLDSAFRDQLLSDYMQAVNAGPDFVPLFHRMTCQRLVQAVGAYGRLASIPGMSHFRTFILPALRMITTALGQLDNQVHLVDLMSQFVAREEMQDAD